MKKIFFAVTLILVMAIQNIVGAADFKSIDWKNAPRFSNKAEFIKYIQNCERNCKASIPVIFTNGLFVKVDEFLNIYKNAQYANVVWVNDRSGKSSQVLYEVNIYPGAKVAYAYRTGDTSILNNEEHRLYNTAVKIVNAAKSQPTDLRKELYIHEKITDSVSYYTAQTNSKTPRHCTAVGALLDGRANCQGYSDTFYMLGQMAGLNVGKMTGNANNGPHVWNTIEFGDGKVYAVDVTFDDATFRFENQNDYNNYVYFNAPLEILQTTHTWKAAYSPQLQPTIDGRYFYATQEFWNTRGKYFGFHSKSAEDALQYIAQRIAKDGWRLSYGMAPFNNQYAGTKFSLNRLVREILPNQYNWYGRIKMSVVRRGDWIFYIVEATAK